MKYFYTVIIIILVLGGIFIVDFFDNDIPTKKLALDNKTSEIGTNGYSVSKKPGRNNVLPTTPLPDKTSNFAKKPLARGLSPLTLPEPPWAKKLDDLRKEARNDPKVAFKLARLLLICAKIPATTEQYKKTLSSLLEYHRVDGLYLSNNESRITHLKSRFAACEGISKSDRLDYHRWLTNAAENGNVFAQVKYGVFPLPKQLTASGLPPKEYLSSEEIKEYRNQALHFLDMAVAQGNAEAMFWRGQAALAGIIAPKNLLEAYTYISAANSVYTHNGLDRELGAFLNELESQILPRKLPQAERASHSLLTSANCCTYFIVPSQTKENKP